MESDKNNNQLLQSAPIEKREKVENEAGEDKNSQHSIKTESIDEEEL